jgi:hypothetical protein
LWQKISKDYAGGIIPANSGYKMVDTLKEILNKLGITTTREAIMYLVAGVVVIMLFVLTLMFLRRRKSKKVINVSPADDGEGGGKPAEGNYEYIIKQIQAKKKYKSILFASIDGEVLPVTIPVNAAIGLAKNKKRCLLIDLDLKRDAVAKVFGLDAGQSDLNIKPVQTEFENLWVWPGHYFSQSGHMNVTGIVEKAKDNFDFILINAPSLVNNLDRRQIILAAQAAFICAKNASEPNKLTELIKSLDCTIIGRIQTP